ncbi:MAG: substrate-binding domain-containing protein [bacterium]|nr:substrate-binding domain-containing protein [bacterium]MXV89880.1 sugar ABC transporter substrate-binding protein [Acidimicrobiia bacterium]MYC45896.1 sugar ABC transporter substrate-binding protein [Acidimicrobiia bacterium]
MKKTRFLLPLLVAVLAILAASCATEDSAAGDLAQQALDEARAASAAAAANTQAIGDAAAAADAGRAEAGAAAAQAQSAGADAAAAQAAADAAGADADAAAADAAAAAAAADLALATAEGSEEAIASAEAALAEAQSEAEAARALAADAQSEADNARSAAAEAQTQADTAQAQADAARAQADAAQVQADAAQAQADAAQAQAGAAQSRADAAEASVSVSDLLDSPTSIGPRTPLSATPEPGKTLIWIECPTPGCVLVGNGITDAAAHLGWTVDRIGHDLTPEGTAGAMAQAVAQNPDAVLISGSVNAFYEDSLATLNERGVPVIDSSSVNEVGGADNGIYGMVQGIPQTTAYGQVLASWIVADSGGNANLLVFNVPDVPVLTGFNAGIAEVMAETCANCVVEIVDVSFADLLGGNVPGLVVSALQANPDAGYVACGFGDLCIGVTGAIAEAGLADRVQLTGALPNAGDFAAIAAGEESAFVAAPEYMIGWRKVDILAAFFVGDDLTEAQTALLPMQVITPETTGIVRDSGGNYIGVADYEAQFLARWGLG